MFIEKQTELDFQKLKSDTINRFEKAYKRVTMKEIRVCNQFVTCYISSLYETCKISYEYNYKSISIVNIYTSDLHEIQQQHIELRKEENDNELLHTL